MSVLVQFFEARASAIQCKPCLAPTSLQIWVAAPAWTNVVTVRTLNCFPILIMTYNQAPTALMTHPAIDRARNLVLSLYVSLNQNQNVGDV